MRLSDIRAFGLGIIDESALNEMAKLDKYKIYQDDAKKVSRLLKEARRESDDKKAKKLYQEALSNAKELRKQAQKLPDDDALDWIFNLFVKPWWWFIVDVAAAASKGDSITAMSRSQAVSHYDTLISQIEKSISDLD